MRIDQVSKPCTFYYESETGENIPFELTDGFPELKWHAQHSKGVLVQHSICFGSRPGKDLWIVRALKWLVDRCPDTWKKPTSSMTFNSTLNGCWPVIKYLVDQRGWDFNNACVVCGDCCERCYNIMEAEVTGQSTNTLYFNTSRTHCKYCKELDPEHNYKYITWRLYRALNQKQDLKKVWAGLKNDLLGDQRECI
jgi:hypothetical protein